MRRTTSLIPVECENCILPDCYPSDSRCLVLRRKASDKGLTLDDVPLDAPVRGRGRIKKLVKEVAPSIFVDKKDYHRKYSREYNLQFRKITVRGVKLKRCDLDALNAVCLADGSTLVDEIIKILEIMAERARTKQEVC